MAIKTSDISSDYTIQLLSGVIQREERIVLQNIPGTSLKTITFNGNFGMGDFGTSYNAVLRISDGSTTIDYSSEDAEGGDSSSSTKIGVGSDRDPRDVVSELVGKINGSALDVVATDNGGTFSAASLSITAGAGKTLTISEDPGNVNSGNFGSTSGFTVITDTSTGGSSIKKGFAPFRFSVNGPFNLRQQPTVGHYKTFLGEQKT